MDLLSTYSSKASFVSPLLGHQRAFLQTFIAFHFTITFRLGFLSMELTTSLYDILFWGRYFRCIYRREGTRDV